MPFGPGGHFEFLVFMIVCIRDKAFQVNHRRIVKCVNPVNVQPVIPDGKNFAVADCNKIRAHGGVGGKYADIFTL